MKMKLEKIYPYLILKISMNEASVKLIKFIKRFSYNGSPKPEVQMNLDKEGWKR